MRKTYVFLFLAALILSGCRQGASGSGGETIGYSGEQVTGEVTEEPETQPEPNVTICTGIESRIVRMDKKFSHIESLDEYLNGKESALVRLYYLDEHSIQGRLYQGDEDKEWTEEDWDFTGEDPVAYDLSWEELKSLRKEREVVKVSQGTGLPRELAELLQGILIRQSWEGWFTADDFSTDDLLEPYKAKSCEVDEEGAKTFLGESVPEYLHDISGAYVADLEGDGKEELIMCSYYGGTIGLENIEIWEQKDEGTGVSMRESYTYWYSYPGLLYVGGHYYYVAELMNHSSGVFEGFLVFSFLEDGTVKLDKVTLESQGEEKIWKKLYENESLDSESLDRVRSYIESKKSEIENGKVLKGKAEIPYESSGYDFAVETFNLWGDESDCTVVDFDNDGEMECCSKKRVSSDHWATQLAVAILKKQGAYVRQLEFSFPGYSFSDYIYCNYWQLWFEEFEGKNYIFNVDRLSGSSDYFLTVQLIQDRKLYPVMNYLLLDRKVCKYEKADPEYYIDFH